ncbi:MAG: hypothetical protein ACKOPM_15465 [Novosphingobium sp.]
MIQSTPATCSPTGIMPGLAVAPAAKEGAEVSDFSALLEIHAASPELPGAEQTLLQVSVDPVTQVPAAPDSPAATGKILPPGLPVAEAVTPGEEPLPVSEVLPQPKTHPAKPITDHPHPVAKRAKVDPVPVSKVLPGKSSDPVPVSDPIAIKPAEVIPVADVIPLKPSEVVPIAEVIPVKPVEVVPIAELLVTKPVGVIPVADDIAVKPKDGTPPEAAFKGQGPVQRTLPDLPEQASARAHEQLERRLAQIPAAPAIAAPVMRRLAEGKAADKPASSVPAPLTAAGVPMAIPAEEIRLAVSLPRVAAIVAHREEPMLGTATGADSIASTTLTSPAPLQPGASMQTIAGATVPQVRPHDFTALIDRLTAAREAMAPQAISLTVAHQEFGPVRLHFRPEDAGLSVAMTSADPDFARAAAAQPAPVLPTAASEQAGSALQQRGEGAPSPQGGFTQSRGQSSERREQHHGQQHQPHGQPERRGAGRAATQRSGIFA